MNRVKNLKDFKQNQNNNKQFGGDLLGSVISWKIQPNSLINDALLWNKIHEHKIPKYLHPKQIKTLASFRKAIAKTNKAIKKDNLMLRSIKKEELGEIVGLVEENKKVVEERLEYDNLGTINYSNDFISSSLSPDNEVLGEVKKWYGFYKNYTSEDISKMLVELANREGIRLLPRGGSYFIPNTNSDLIDRLKLFVSQVNPENSLYTLELYGTSSSQSDLVNLTQRNLEKEIDGLIIDSNKFLEEANSERKSYDTGIKNRQNEARILAQKIENMSKVLNLKSDSLSTSLTTLNKTLMLDAPKPNNIIQLDLNSTQLEQEAGF